MNPAKGGTFPPTAGGGEKGPGKTVGGKGILGGVPLRRRPNAPRWRGPLRHPPGGRRNSGDPPLVGTEASLEGHGSPHGEGGKRNHTLQVPLRGWGRKMGKLPGPSGNPNLFRRRFSRVPPRAVGPPRWPRWRVTESPPHPLRFFPPVVNGAATALRAALGFSRGLPPPWGEFVNLTLAESPHRSDRVNPVRWGANAAAEHRVPQESAGGKTGLLDSGSYEPLPSAARKYHSGTMCSGVTMPLASM